MLVSFIYLTFTRETYPSKSLDQKHGPVFDIFRIQDYAWSPDLEINWQLAPVRQNQWGVTKLALNIALRKKRKYSQPIYPCFVAIRILMFLLKVFFYKEFFHEAEATTSVLINSNHNASIIKGCKQSLVMWLFGYYSSVDNHFVVPGWRSLNQCSKKI